MWLSSEKSVAKKEKRSIRGVDGVVFNLLSIIGWFRSDEVKKIAKRRQHELIQWNDQQKFEVIKLRNTLELLSRWENLEAVFDRIPLFRDIRILQDYIKNWSNFELFILRLIWRKEANETHWMLAVNQVLNSIIEEKRIEINEALWQFLSYILKWGARFILESWKLENCPVSQIIRREIDWKSVDLMIAFSRNQINVNSLNLNVSEIQRLYLVSAVNTKLQHILADENSKWVTDWIWEWWLVNTIHDLPWAFIRRTKKLEEMLNLRDLDSIRYKKSNPKEDCWLMRDNEWREYNVFDIMETEKEDIVYLNDWLRTTQKRIVRYRILSKEIYDFLRTGTLRTRFSNKKNDDILTQIEYLFAIQRTFLVYPIVNDIRLLQGAIDSISNMISKWWDIDSTKIRVSEIKTDEWFITKDISVRDMTRKLIERDLRDPDWDLIIHTLPSFINRVSQNKSWWILLSWDIVKLSRNNCIDTGSIIFSNVDNIVNLNIYDIIMHNFEWSIMQALRKFVKDYSSDSFKIICAIQGDEFFIFIPDDLSKANLPRLGDKEVTQFFKNTVRYYLRNEKDWRPFECRIVDTVIEKQKDWDSNRLDYVSLKITRITNLLSIRKELKDIISNLELEYDYLSQLEKNWEEIPILNRLKIVLNFFKWSRVTDWHWKARIDIPPENLIYLRRLLQKSSIKTFLNKTIMRSTWNVSQKKNNDLIEHIIKSADTWDFTFELFSIVHYLDLFLNEVQGYIRIRWIRKTSQYDTMVLLGEWW